VKGSATKKNSDMKKKSIEAKIVKHAHRRRFQDYVRTKGREKATIAYVYWSMFLRSGKGNVFELEESLFLGDLGIGKNALRPARKTLVDDGWLTKDQQKIDPLTGKWGTTAWTVNTQTVALSDGVGTAAPLTGDRSADVGSAGDRSEGDTVVLHSLYASNPEASTYSCPPTPSASEGTFPDELTNSSTNKYSVQFDDNEDSNLQGLESLVAKQEREEQPQEQNPNNHTWELTLLKESSPLLKKHTWEMPLSGTVLKFPELWAQMWKCWEPFRNAKPTDEEVLLFGEVMAKCDENTCYPYQLMEYARTHMPPKLYGALRSVKGLHNAVINGSTTNGLLAQFKDHKDPNNCHICLKKVQGVVCKTAGCKSWVVLGMDGTPEEYCPGCINKIPQYRRDSGKRGFLMQGDL
jgi:hypothetical protein